MQEPPKPVMQEPPKPVMQEPISEEQKLQQLQQLQHLQKIQQLQHLHQLQQIQKIKQQEMLKQDAERKLQEKQEMLKNEVSKQIVELDNDKDITHIVNNIVDDNQKDDAISLVSENSNNYTKSKLLKLNLDKLKEICEKDNLSTEGTKGIIIDRILNAEL